jgi:long-subunit acyl-CoA synthetase (AMP-forming)
VQTRLAEDGEILVKSPGRMAGYYKEPALTAESITADGYFKTGDLGRYDEQGLLQLTGRKKELFKTAKGKYVAPAPIEGRLAAHPMVEMALVADRASRRRTRWSCSTKPCGRASPRPACGRRSKASWAPCWPR